jgi:type I restriction enzyme, S subunit
VIEMKTAWPVHRLGDIARTATGGTPKRDHPEYFSGHVAWVKSGELRDGLVHTTEEHLTDEGLDSCNAKVFPKGTLCIALYGATVGRLGILDIEAATNQAICGIFPGDALDVRFLFRFLESRRSELIQSAKGGAQPNISQQIVRDLAVPVPPVKEQRDIVAAIDTQFSRVDAARANLASAQAHLRRYRQSVLKAAVEGRLVPTDAELNESSIVPEENRRRVLATERQEAWRVDVLAGEFLG